MPSSDASAARRVPLRDDTVGGEPALFVPRWTAPARIGRGVLAALAAALLLGAAWSAYLAAWGWLALTVALGVAVAGLLLRDARRMPYDGGLWLTPTGVRHTWSGRTWSLAWPDVAGVGPDADHRDVVLRARSGEEHVVSSHLLVMSGPAVVAAVEAVAGGSEDLRDELGTEVGRQRMEALRDAVDPADFSPRVHGALPTTTRGVLTASLLLVLVLLALAWLGRGTTVDQDDLAGEVTTALADRGREVTGVTCEDDLEREVGASVRCSGTEAGERRAISVTVTEVGEESVDYDIAVR